MIATAYKNIHDGAGYIRFTELTQGDIDTVRTWSELTAPTSGCAWATNLSSLTVFFKNEEDYVLSLLRWT